MARRILLRKQMRQTLLHGETPRQLKLENSADQLSSGSNVADQILVRQSVAFFVNFFTFQLLAGPFPERRALRRFHLRTLTGGGGQQTIVFVDRHDQSNFNGLLAAIADGIPFGYLDPQSDITLVTFVEISEPNAQTPRNRFGPDEIIVERGQGLWFWNESNLTKQISATLTWGL